MVNNNAQLNTFLAVVRTGSVTAAADALYVTQPSVSAALSALAKEVGVDLTERDGRSLRLTPADKIYARYAADVVGLLDAGARPAREAADASARELRITAVNTAGEYLVAPLMRAFRVQHPDVELTLDVGNRQQVADHEADVGIGGRPPDDGTLVGTGFLANEIVLVAALDDPLVGRRKVPVKELGERQSLLREEGSGTRTMIEEFLVRRALRREIHTLGYNGAIKRRPRSASACHCSPGMRSTSN